MIFKRLISFLIPFRKFVILAIILGWGTTISWFALISTSSYLISYAALHPSIAELQIAIVGVRFFGISRGVLRYLERLTSHSVTLKLLSNLRVWFYENVEPLAPAGLQDYQGGDLLSRILDDVETLQEFYVRVVGPSLVAVLASFTVITVVGQWSVQLGVVIFLFHILTGLIVPYLVRMKSIQFGRKIILERADLSTLIIDAVQGNADILLNCYEDKFEAKAMTLVNINKETERELYYLHGIHSGLTSLSINMLALVLLFVAIPKITAGEVDGRLLAVIVLGGIASFEAILPLPQTYQKLEESLLAGKRLFEIVDQKPEVNDIGKKRKEQTFRTIEIKNLDFAYSHNFSLQNINLSIRIGKKIALVGHNGAGKTTIANLLLGFWNYSKGEILINGQIIGNYDRDDIRKLIAYVPQNPYLFNGTIMENIRIGGPGASVDEIEKAARIAGAHKFIEALPQGYQTEIGEWGAFLSGGQRQRIGIAQAVLKNTPLYILDEPYANIDPFTKKMIQNSMAEFLRKRSLLLITHQIDDLKNMDEIVVLRNGRIIERGNDQDLRLLSGEYAQMIKMEENLLSHIKF